MIPDTLEELVDMEKLKENFTNIVNDLRSEYSEKLALRTSQSAFSNLQINVQGGKKIALQYLGEGFLLIQTAICNRLPKFFSDVVQSRLFWALSC